MTSEVAILRAYAYASQGKYAKAEQLLASVPEALNTPSGADILARIRFEQGDEAAARHIWEQMLAVDPSNESARKALAALDVPPCELGDDTVVSCFCRRWKYVVAALLAMLLGISFSLGKACRGTVPPQSRIIAEQTLDISKINGKILEELSNGILTNMTDNTVLVISGGMGKYVTDRQRSLSVIAESISQIAGVQMGDILISVAEDSQKEVNIAIVPKIIPPKKREEQHVD